MHSNYMHSSYMHCLLHNLVTVFQSLAKATWQPASKVVSLFTLLAIAWHKGQPYWTKVDWNASLIA